MKHFIAIIIICFSVPAAAQDTYYLSDVIYRVGSTDSLYFKNSNRDSIWKCVSGECLFYYKSIRARYYNWNFIENKPATYTPSEHTHAISDISLLQAALDAKGSSSFDGAYSSLTGKPATFTPSSHTHTISDISNFGSYLNISDSAAMLIKYLRKQDTADMLGPYVRANVAAATYSALDHVHTIANTTGLQAALDAKQASLGYTPLNPANNLSEVTAATARGNLGATTVGANIFTLTNPSAIRFLRINADNTVTARTAAEILSDIGAQASGSYLTGNQTISFAPTGDVTGSSSNATSLTPVLTIGALKVTNGMLAGSIAYSKLLLTGAILNADLAGSIAYNKLALTGSILNADLAGAIAASKLVGTDIATLGKNTSYNGVTSVSNGLSQVVATIDATAQTANIATATLYAVPSAGFYRVSIYITVTSVGTTSTMPSTTITYTDGNSGTNAHSTTTTATNAGNSLTTSFAQATYVLYAKASTNIQYATGSYASTGTPMQYALRIRVEAL